MSESGLTEFQIELANVFFSLPESDGFLLAGGGALIAQGLVHRPTEDLDFFTAWQLGSVEATSEALTSASLARGWTVELLRRGPEFRRWAIVGPETVLVDLAVASPASGAPTLTIAGPALAASELVVRKTLALFGRAEPRDFIDVYVLNQQFDRDNTLRKAAAVDLGFDLTFFAQALRSHRRIDDQDFPDVGVPVPRSVPTSIPGPTNSQTARNVLDVQRERRSSRSAVSGVTCSSRQMQSSRHLDLCGRAGRLIEYRCGENVRSDPDDPRSRPAKTDRGQTMSDLDLVGSGDRI